MDISSHRAKTLSLEALEEASIVFAMEQKHINYVTQNLCASYQGYQNRIVLLLEYLGGDFEFDKLIGNRDVTKYTDFAKWFGLLRPRIAYMIKRETLYPLLMKGVGVSTGVAIGKVKLVHSASEADRVKNGDVMVCKSNSIIQMYGGDGLRRASAIITDSRSQIHHLSEISHKLNIPCVGGTEFATQLLQDEQVVILDSTSGLVYGKEGEW
jgi:phosphohistidine swiveling domain-containing protein